MSILKLAAIFTLCGCSVYRQTKTSDVFGHYRFKMAVIYGIGGVCIGVHIPHSLAAKGLRRVKPADQRLGGRHPRA
jgi:hypothetical protein